MKIKLLFAYKGPKTAEIRAESDWFDERLIEPLAVDMHKTGRINDVNVMDEMGREWTLKQYRKLMEKMEEEPKNPIIYFDGGYDRENMVAGIGIVVYYEKSNEKFRIRHNAKLTELESNNEAEYAALYHALVLLEQLGMRHSPCTIHGDAQGVLRQLDGEWPCYENTLNRWLDRIEEKISKLDLKPTYHIISRAENKEADKLASQALQNKIIDSHLKIDNKL